MQLISESGNVGRRLSPFTHGIALTLISVKHEKAQAE
jgi:hypothetical protein